MSPSGGHSQWTHDAIMTSLWRQNDVVTSFWRHDDVIIASCARWVPRTTHLVPRVQPLHFTAYFKIGYPFSSLAAKRWQHYRVRDGIPPAMAAGRLGPSNSTGQENYHSVWKTCGHNNLAYAAITTSPAQTEKCPMTQKCYSVQKLFFFKPACTAARSVSKITKEMSYACLYILAAIAVVVDKVESWHFEKTGKTANMEHNMVLTKSNNC